MRPQISLKFGESLMKVGHPTLQQSSWGKPLWDLTHGANVGWSRPKGPGGHPPEGQGDNFPPLGPAQGERLSLQSS